MERKTIFDDMDLEWQITSLSVDSENLVRPSNDNNEWLKDVSHKINLAAKPIFDQFFDANDVQPSEMPQ